MTKKQRIYFDNAATTPLSEEVRERMCALMQTCWGNPSSIHAEGRKARALVEQARKTVATCLGASIGEIFFTSGGTESNNMILKNSVRDLGVRRIISSPLEHHSVLHSLQRLERAGVEVVYLPVDQKGRIDLEELRSLLAQEVQHTLVSLMYVNNEIGNVLDLESVSNLCLGYGALFHSDTVQGLGRYPLNLSDLKLNFLSGSAHKFHGPKGVGLVYINSENIIGPFLDGGAQERNMRGSTENVYGIVGLALALQTAVEEMAERRQKIEQVKFRFKKRLLQEFRDVRFEGDDENSHYTILSVSFPPSGKSDLLLMLLDIEGVSASGGSACSSGVEQGSHVLEAIRADEKRKMVRFSFSHYNTVEEVDSTVDILKKILYS